MTKSKSQKIKERDGHKCVKCGSTDDLTIDHIIPLSRGGKDEAINLQTLCFKCNLRKGSRIEWGFLKRITIALHVDEHINNLSSKFKGDLLSSIGVLKSQLHEHIRNENSKLWTSLRDKDAKIEELKNKLSLLENYLKIEYHEEVIEKKGYRKRKA